MVNKSAALRLYATLAALLLLTASPALAQFQPRPTDDPATGERYRIEGFAGLWSPTADMSLAVEDLGIAGTRIDFRNDLGLTDRRIRELRLTLRPARKHKFRFQAVPIQYSEGPVTVNHDIVFLGQRYRVGVPLNWSLDWTTYRMGYEYDFISRDRGFGGFVADVKYTRVSAEFESPVVTCPSPDPPACVFRVRGPIPAIGGIARVNIIPKVSITGEVTGLIVPESLAEGYKAHYADIDIYGMVNFNNYIGAQVGWRSLDVGVFIKDDNGAFVLNGLYFGVVARY